MTDWRVYDEPYCRKDFITLLSFSTLLDGHLNIAEF